MGKSIINYRTATLKDADQISSVLMDFYNMKDINEAYEAVVSEMGKDFHYIVALNDDIVLLWQSWASFTVF